MQRPFQDGEKRLIVGSAPDVDVQGALRGERCQLLLVGRVPLPTGPQARDGGRCRYHSSVTLARRQPMSALSALNHQSQVIEALQGTRLLRAGSLLHANPWGGSKRIRAPEDPVLGREELLQGLAQGLGQWQVVQLRPGVLRAEQQR